MSFELLIFVLFSGSFLLFLFSLLRLGSSPVVSYVPTAALENDGHGSEKLAGWSSAPIAFDLRSFVYAMEDLKGVPADITVIVISRHSSHHLSEEFFFRSFSLGAKTQHELLEIEHEELLAAASPQCLLHFSFHFPFYNLPTLIHFPLTLRQTYFNFGVTSLVKVDSKRN